MHGMAVRIQCLACGMQSIPGKLGIRDGEYVPEGAPEYEGLLSTYEIRGRIGPWHREPMPLDYARAMRDRLADVLAQLEAQIADAER